jgi:hypothetical protein
MYNTEDVHDALSTEINHLRWTMSVCGMRSVGDRPWLVRSDTSITISKYLIAGKCLYDSTNIVVVARNGQFEMPRMHLKPTTSLEDTSNLQGVPTHMALFIL